MSKHSHALWMLLLALPCCSGTQTPEDPASSSYEGLSSRLSQSHGYEVDDKGNWIPRNDKRSQYEGQGDSPQFRGDLGKREFDTKSLQKGSWWGSKQLERPAFADAPPARLSSETSRFQRQQAALDHSLDTPARIDKNYRSKELAVEAAGRSWDKPSHAATDLRRDVFIEPEIIDYKQQRELSIRQSKDLLGR